MKLRDAPDRLDAALVPRLAAWAGTGAAAYRTCRDAAPVRLLRRALTDTGLLGPGIAVVLLAACLLAATGAS